MQSQDQDQYATSSPHGRETHQMSSTTIQEESKLHFRTQSEELSPALRSAHNVTLLELLEPRPQNLDNKFYQSRSNATENNGEERSLSMPKERELATNLAFLAGISGYSDHIMGVCVEELPDIKGCQVMVSVNQCRPSDGIEILKRVEKGFEQIFGRLAVLSADSSRQERLDVMQTVFNDIIALCHKRILIRLRSRHAEVSYKSKNHNRRSLGSVMRDFIATTWRRSAENSSPLLTKRNMNVYRPILEDLVGDLDDFEATDDVHHQNLLRLVKSISETVKRVPIEGLVSLLDNNDMDPKLRTWLVGCLNKIHRYREIASILCRRARRIPMLRNVRVRLISGLVGCNNTSISSGKNMDIWRSLARFQYMGETVQMGMLPEWLRVQAQLSADLYSQNVRKTLKEAKVHAEIQLLAYYENHPVEGIRPRILAASKKACALCNAFIAIHGVYRVPKSHGKLYRGWRLPPTHQKGPLQDDLNEVLESSITETLSRLLQVSRRPRNDFENESSIFSFSLSASTRTDSSISHVSKHHNATLAVAGMDLGVEVPRTPSAQSHGAERPSIESLGTQISEENEDAFQGVSDDRESKHTDDRAKAPVPQDSTYIEGSTVTIACSPANVKLKPGRKELFSPKQRGISCFRSRCIELVIDESSSCFSLELLRAAEAEKVLRDDTTPVTDVRTVLSVLESTMPKSANGQTYISHGEEVIRVCTRTA